MFERWTERARQVIVLAQDEARAMKHGYIGTEHLLLGLLREEEGLAARTLDGLNVTVDGVREHIKRIVGLGEEATTAYQIPLTPRAKKVCELGLREALSMGHNYIGTEHVLLGLIRENEGVAIRILETFEADADTIRDQIIRTLSGPGRKKAKTPEPKLDPPGLAEAHALHEIIATLGPVVDCPHIACQGCQAEMSEALRIAKAAVA